MGLHILFKMKRIIYISIVCALSINNYGQTFRNAFDNYESGPGGAFGQGLSYNINIQYQGAYLLNVEAITNNYQRFFNSLALQIKAWLNSNICDYFLWTVWQIAASKQNIEGIFSVSNFSLFLTVYLFLTARQKRGRRDIHNFFIRFLSVLFVHLCIRICSHKRVNFFSSKIYVKKLSIAIFLFLLSSVLNAQEKKDSIDFKWKIAVNGSGIYTFPPFHPHGNSSISFSSGWGFNIEYKLDNKINIVFGINYDLLKYKTTFFQDTSATSGYLRIDILSYSLLGISTKVKLKIGNKKLFFSITPGLNCLILTNNNYQSFRPFKYETRLFSNGQKMIAGSLAAGINYCIGDNLIVFIEPEIIQSFSPIIYEYTTASGDVQTRYHYLSYFKLNLGLNYWIKKHKK